MEACQEKRKRYLEFIKQVAKDKLVYIDESGIEANMVRNRGWGKKERPLHDQKSGKHYERTNIIAGLVDKKIIAPMVFTGYCNTELFDAYVEQCLLKELTEGQTVIMDNATLHRSHKVKELIESAGCKLSFIFTSLFSRS